MKRNKIYAWMAAAMTLAACSTNDIADLGGNDANNVVNVAATRANTSSNSNAIKAFHLVNTTQQSEYDKKYEADYKYDDASSTYVMTNGTVLWCNTDDNEGNKVENVFQAFTPLSTAANLASYDRFYIPIYQASPELLAAADWMTATATSTKAAATDGLSLNFEHRNAKLHFDVTVKDDAAALTSEDITVIGNITPYYSANESNKTIEAIVAPVSADEITSSTSRPTLISFRLAGGDEISVPLPTSISQIEAGKQYNFNITVGHHAATISSVNVTDWNNQDITEDENDEAIGILDIPYVTFTSDDEMKFKISIQDRVYPISGLEYSVNNGDWIAIPEKGISDIQFGGSYGNLRLRGKNLNGTASGNSSYEAAYISFTSDNPDAKVACTGDIRTLLDYENYKTVDTSNARFTRLFMNCTQLTSPPELPATTLAKNCYYYMFRNCTSLTTAPELPATTLAESCYSYMFYGCTKLESVTMLATDVSASDCLYDWITDAGTGATSRALTVASQTAYDAIVGNLPDIWKLGEGKATVIYKGQ